MNSHQSTVVRLRSTIRRRSMVIAVLVLSLLPVDAPKGQDGIAASLPPKR